MKQIRKLLRKASGKMQPLKQVGFAGKGIKCGADVKLKAAAGLFIGDNTSIQSGAKIITACRTGSGYNLAFEPIYIGKNATIGHNALLLPGALVKDNETIAPGTMVEAPEQYEAYNHALAPKQNNMLDAKMPILFVLGTGRSGTTSLSKSFDQIDGAWNGHETFWALIPWSVKYAHGEMSREELKIKISLLLSQYTLPSNTTLVVESNHRLWNMIPLLEEIYADNPPHYLFISRDKESFVRSALERNWYTPQPADDYTIYPHHYFRPTAHAMGEMTPQAWQQLTPEGKLAWYWDKINSTILHDLNQLPAERTLYTTLENLGDTTAQIRQRLNLPQAWSIPVANEGKKKFAEAKISNKALEEMARFNTFETMLGNTRFAESLSA